MPVRGAAEEVGVSLWKVTVGLESEELLANGLVSGETREVRRLTVLGGKGSSYSNCCCNRF